MGGESRHGRRASESLEAFARIGDVGGNARPGRPLGDWIGPESVAISDGRESHCACLCSLQPSTTLSTSVHPEGFFECGKPTAALAFAMPDGAPSTYMRVYVSAYMPVSV